MKFNPQPKPEKTEKKAKKPLKRTAIKYKPKKTGQLETFAKIAEARVWVCFVTDVHLTKLTATQFMHVLPKAQNRYPMFKNYEKNIVLGADWVHDAWDKSPRSELLARDPRFQRLFDLEAELKEEYKQLYG